MPSPFFWQSIWGLTRGVFFASPGGTPAPPSGFTFTGLGDGSSWDDAANWSGLAVPGASDDAVIPTGFGVVLADDSVDSLTVNGGSGVSTGNLAASGTVTFNDNSGLVSGGTITGPCILNGNSGVNGGNVVGNCTFNDNSTLGGGGSVIGTCVFNGTGGISGATVTGNCTFNDSSFEFGAVTGDCIFNGMSQQRNVIHGSGTFNDESQKTGGTIDNDALFVGNLSEFTGGTVSGSVTRKYLSNITVTRNFTTDGSRNDWTILASGCVVNVVNATFASTNTFSTASGGSFVFPTLSATTADGTTIVATSNSTSALGFSYNNGSWQTGATGASPQTFTASIQTPIRIDGCNVSIPSAVNSFAVIAADTNTITVSYSTASPNPDDGSTIASYTVRFTQVGETPQVFTGLAAGGTQQSGTLNPAKDTTCSVEAIDSLGRVGVVWQIPWLAAPQNFGATGVGISQVFNWDLIPGYSGDYDYNIDGSGPFGSAVQPPDPESVTVGQSWQVAAVDTGGNFASLLSTAIVPRP